MQAIQIVDNQLLLCEIASPVLLPQHVRIRVHATAVNRADLMQRRGLYPPPPFASDILGLECAGEIIEVGEGVQRFCVGDKVMALLAGGGYATEVVVSEHLVLLMPAHFSFVQAAAFPETFLTAFLNLFLLGRVKSKDVVLVHGGSGGVGTSSIALCKYASVTILVTCSASKKQHLETLGADLAIDYRTENFVERVLDFTKKRGVHVVLDCVGAEYLQKNLEVLATEGRLISIGLMSGHTTPIDLRVVLSKRLQLIGSTLRPLSLERKTEIIQKFLLQFGEALNTGLLNPVIDCVLPLGKAEEAHHLMQESKHVGKIVLQCE